MVSKSQGHTTTNYNWLKWLLVICFLVVGITANYIYSGQPWPLRLIAWLVLLALIIGIIFVTTQGKAFINFSKESQLELRKVFWPTRQETIQTTLVVAAVVVLLSLILWGVDGVLMRLIGWLAGQRG